MRFILREVLCEVKYEINLTEAEKMQCFVKDFGEGNLRVNGN